MRNAIFNIIPFPKYDDSRKRFDIIYAPGYERNRRRQLTVNNLLPTGQYYYF